MLKKDPATFDYENSLWKENKKFIAGVDEVGRGAWAGPLVAAAVIFPPFHKTENLYFDSKLLTSRERELLSRIIKKEAVCFGIGLVEVEIIVKQGLTYANQLAFTRAIKNLKIKPDHLLVDSFLVRSFAKKQQTPIIKGDCSSASIAAASIIAKVFRDEVMKKLAKTYYQYNFSLNKGYGTASHQEAIKKFGLSEIHRTSYNLKVLQGSGSHPEFLAESI